MIYMMNVFEYMFQNNSGVHFSWTGSFISWILSCCLWVLQLEIISLVFTVASIILCFASILSTSDMNLESNSILKRARNGISSYILIISISILVMVISNSLAVGFTSNVMLFLFLYDWRQYQKHKNLHKIYVNK